MDRKTSFNGGDISEEDAAAIFNASGVSMVLTNPRLDDNPIVYVNHAFEKLTGYSAAMAVGRNCRFLQAGHNDQPGLDALRRAVARQEQISVVLENYRADGAPFCNALLISPVVEEQSGGVAYFIGLQSEIDPNYQAEALQRFEAIVAELQHRVKNHLSMIIGLIRMKARESDQDDGLHDLSRRIESLQLLYEEMASARAQSNEDKIQLGSYLGRVANAIAHLDGRPGVRMNINVEPLMMQTETAVRVGLVVSEILTNAMQHAFRDQNSGLVELRVTRTDGGGMRAIITDDGVGLPKDVEWPNMKGLGGRIVSGLCEGLRATLHVSRGAVGTIVTLDVPNAD